MGHILYGKEFTAQALLMPEEHSKSYGWTQLRKGTCFAAKGNGELLNLLLPDCCEGRIF